MENLVLRARSETEGSASEFCDKIPSGDNQSRVLWARIFTEVPYSFEFHTASLERNPKRNVWKAFGQEFDDR
jgi:hypothetical protein